MRKRNAGLCVVAVAVLTAVPAGAARAQVVDLRLAMGLYQPTKDQARHTDATTGQLSSYHAGAASALDGRVTVWLSRVFGFELGAAHASPARTEVAAASVSSPAAITLYALRGVRRFRLGGRMALLVAAGPARVRIAGASYDTAAVQLEQTSGGVNAALSLTRTLGSRLALVAGVDDWIYQLDEVRGAPTLVASGTRGVRQHDLLISLGLVARF